MNKTVTVDTEVLDAVAALVAAADVLCTAVISGSQGQMKLALATIRAMDDIKRIRIGHTNTKNPPQTK